MKKDVLKTNLLRFYNSKKGCKQFLYGKILNFKNLMIIFYKLVNIYNNSVKLY